MADKKRKRKTKKLVANLSQYAYIDMEHAMQDLDQLVFTLTKKKSELASFRKKVNNRTFSDATTCEILELLKGTW